MRKLSNQHCRIAIIFWLLAAIIAGCAQWNTQETSNGVPQLPIPKMSRDSIGIEIATVTIDAERLGMLNDIFSRLDEQVLPPESRQFLSRNGFRAGALGVQLPENLKLLLLETADRQQHPTADTRQYQDTLQYIQCRRDVPRKVQLWQKHGDVVANYDNGEFKTSEELKEANCHLLVTGTPNDSMSATIQIVPEIAYGPLRQQYVVEDNAFHI